MIIGNMHGRQRTVIHSVLCVLVLASNPTWGVSLNPRGFGEALIYPYYTVQKSQDTLVSIVNGTDTAKVVGVLLREGMNGRPALSFHLYLSAFDAWTARVSAQSNEGGAVLVTRDSSCTWPLLPPEGLPLRVGLIGDDVYMAPDGGPEGSQRTREGSIEFVEAATIMPASALELTIQHPMEDAEDVAPECDPERIRRPEDEAVTAPAGGLSGAAVVVNVGEGTFFGYDAIALSDFSDTPILVAASSGTTVSYMHDWLLRANSVESERGGAVAYLDDDEGRQVALDYAAGIDAVSAVFMSASIANDYLVAPDLGAATDWVVSFPTRSYHVDGWYTPSGVQPPFENGASAARSDVQAFPFVYDQNGRCQDCWASPPVGQRPFRLGWQVNVIAFREGVTEAASPVLGSRLTTDLAPFDAAGWASLEFAGASLAHELPGGLAERRPTTLFGLPATGFMVYNIINSNAAPGRLANYGGAFGHRTTMLCISEAQDGSPASCRTGVDQR